MLQSTNDTMAPTSASLKTHTGHGNRRDGSNARTNGGGGVGDSEDATHFEHHLNGTPGRHRSSSGDPRHRPRRTYHHNHRRFDNLRLDEDGPGGITTPMQVRESSEGEDDNSSWYSSAITAPSETPNVQTEVDVIRDWFVNIFQPVEKTADLEVTDFKFEQISHLRNSISRHSVNTNGHPDRLNGNKDQANRSFLSSRLPFHKKSQHINGQQNGGTGESETDTETTLPNSPSYPFPEAPFTVLKKADVELKVGGKPKTYSVVIKVLPTDDAERHTSRKKFLDLLKFSKEVQVYARFIKCMNKYDEIRYPSACVEPPVPKCYLGQLDAQNDVLVLENLGHSGYRKYAGKWVSDIDHCKVVLRRLAHFHAFSMIITRDANMSLLDLYPFAVDASTFREAYQSKMAIVKYELCKYLMASSNESSRPRIEGCVIKEPDEVSTREQCENKIERHLQELLWRLIELRAQPKEEKVRMCVLGHGCLDLRNIVFQYDEASGRPIACKFLDFSTLTVASPVIDLTYFLHSSVVPELASHHHGFLLQIYHRSHLEAIESFGIYGYEMELEDLVNEYQLKQDYGAMMACLIKPALYVLQCINATKGNLGSKRNSSSSSRNNDHDGGKNGASKQPENNDATSNINNSNGAKSSSQNLLNGSSSKNGEEEENIQTSSSPIIDDISLEHTCSLKVDKNLVPVDLRLHAYLANLAKACPCPCSVGSRDLTLQKLSTDSLQELHIQAKKENESNGLKAFDCNGSTKKTLKQLFKDFVKHEQQHGCSHSTVTSNSNNSKDEDHPTKSHSSKKA